MDQIDGKPINHNYVDDNDNDNDNNNDHTRRLAETRSVSLCWGAPLFLPVLKKSSKK